jgi:pSer/pThr/pTyr-binding forkhead associated (FHA) protein
MSETRLIVGHARHKMQGPHGHPPGDFVPLRLCVENHGVRVEVTCPVAVVGRHSHADLRIAHPEISRRHCRFAFENGKWRVRDLKSLNGVILNNERVAEATVYAGDRLRLGCVTLLVEEATPAPIAPLEAGTNDKLRQIMDVLPMDTRQAG